MQEFHGTAESEALYKSLNQSDLGDISDAEQALVSKKMEALDKFFAKRLDAKYKVEVLFGKERSTWKPCAGALSIYLSGTKLHGGGDEKLYLCPRKDCGGVIFPNERLGGTVMCRKCEVMQAENDLVGELLFRLTPKDWAHVILKYYVKLDHNADIYLKYHPTDIRYKAAMEIARNRGGEEINKARKNRGLHIYPLNRIVRDVSNGADLYDRFLSFITA